MNKSEQIGSLVGALAKAQLAIRNPPLDSVNPHFKNRYASLGAHLDAIRGEFAKHELIMTQSIGNDDTRVSVTTMIAHSSGEWMSSTVAMPLPDRATAQNLGAIVTYLRRYSIGAMALLTGEEDDDADSDRTARQRPVVQPAVQPVVTAAKPKPKSADVFSPSAVAKVGSAKDAEQSKLRWPQSGVDVVIPSKIVERADHSFAVLCAHAVHGSQWVCFPSAVGASVKEDKKIELTWDWNKAGYIEALEVRAAPKLSEMISGGAA